MLAVVLVILVLGVIGLLLAWLERERARVSQGPSPLGNWMLERSWPPGTSKEAAPSILSEQEPVLFYALLRNLVVSIVQQELRREREGEPHLR
jgi:hypothetical protein